MEEIEHMRDSEVNLEKVMFLILRDEPDIAAMRGLPGTSEMHRLERKV